MIPCRKSVQLQKTMPMQATMGTSPSSKTLPTGTLWRSLSYTTSGKQNDSDVFNKVSGTTGLTGSADATFVLEKEKRASDTAKLYVTGRDTPYQEYTPRFRDCRWELVERKTQEANLRKKRYQMSFFGWWIL